MRILVTGGTGLIGRHAIKELKSLGHDVFAITRSFKSMEPVLDTVFVECDMLARNADFLTLFAGLQIDTLLHLAWETEHGKFWNANSNSAWLSSSLRLADCFLKAGGQRIVCAGTCVEYDAPDIGPCIPGQTPLNPIHPYSISKDALRRMLNWMTRSHAASFAWGRVFMVMGPDESPNRLVPYLINALLRGQPALCSSGRQIRDFMHAKDLGSAFAHLACSDYDGELNMCSGQQVAIADIVNRLADMLGHPELVKLGARPDKAGDPPNLWGENNILRQQIGFTPMFTLDSSLEDVINWWRIQ